MGELGFMHMKSVFDDNQVKVHAGDLGYPPPPPPR